MSEPREGCQGRECGTWEECARGGVCVPLENEENEEDE